MTVDVGDRGEEKGDSDADNVDLGEDDIRIETIGRVSAKEYLAQRRSAPWTTNRAWAEMPDHLRRSVKLWCGVAVRRQGGGYDGGLKSADDSMSLLSSEDSEDEVERREMRSPSTSEAPSGPQRIPAERKNTLSSFPHATI